MPDTFPVHMKIGSEQVQVGFAVRTAEGFLFQPSPMVIGTTPVAAPKSLPGELPTTLPNYGKSKGAPIRGASMQDLEFYANGARRSIADPGKARFHEKERALLEAIAQEMERQQGGGGEPPPDDETGLPF